MTLAGKPQVSYKYRSPMPSLHSSQGRTRASSRNVGRLSSYQVKEENFHHFMSAGAAEKSLQSLTMCMYIRPFAIHIHVTVHMWLSLDRSLWENVTGCHRNCAVCIRPFLLLNCSIQKPYTVVDTRVCGYVPL